MKIGYSYFGRCRGVQHINGGSLPQEFGTNEVVDLDPYKVELKPGSRLLRITKDDGGLYFISLYSFAREMESNRGGSFIGASLAFIDCIAPADLIYGCLNSMLEYMITGFLNSDSRFNSELTGKTLNEPNLFTNIKAYSRTLQKAGSIKEENGFIEFEEFQDYTYGINMIHNAFKPGDLYSISDLYGSSNKRIIAGDDFIHTSFDLNYTNQIQESSSQLSSIRNIYKETVQEADVKKNELEKIQEDLLKDSEKINEIRITLQDLKEKEDVLDKDIISSEEKLNNIISEIEEKKNYLELLIEDLAKKENDLESLKTFKSEKKEFENRVNDFESEKVNFQKERKEFNELKKRYENRKNKKSKKTNSSNSDNIWEQKYIAKDKELNEFIQKYNREVKNNTEGKTTNEENQTKKFSFKKLLPYAFTLLAFSIGFGINHVLFNNNEGNQELESVKQSFQKEKSEFEKLLKQKEVKISELEASNKKLLKADDLTNTLVSSNDDSRLIEYEKLLDKIATRNNIYTEAEFEDYLDFIRNPDTDLKKRGKKIYFNYGNTNRPLASFKTEIVSVKSNTFYDFALKYLDSKESNFEELGGQENYMKSIEFLNPKTLPDATKINPGIKLKVFFPKPKTK